MNAQPFCLPYDDVNRGHALCQQLRGLVECVRSASLSHDEPPEDAIAATCWLAADLIEAIEKIIGQRVADKQDAA